MRNLIIALAIIAPSTAASGEYMSRIDAAPGPEVYIGGSLADDAVIKSSLAICGTTRDCQNAFVWARNGVVTAVDMKAVSKKAVQKAIAANTENDGSVNWPWVARSIPALNAHPTPRTLGRTSCTTIVVRSIVRTTCVTR